jgi:hypothetical protein
LNSGDLLMLEKFLQFFSHSTEIISLTWIQHNLDCWSLETHLTGSLVRWLEPHTILVLLLVGFCGRKRRGEKQMEATTGTSKNGATTPVYNEKRMSVRDWEREFKDFARGRNFLAIILGTEDDPKDQTTTVRAKS